MSSREQNERKFGRFRDLPDGARRYELEVPGREGRKAIYVKEVDGFERTIRFCQEIYDEQGRLVEVHEKYPVDTGHREVL